MITFKIADVEFNLFTTLVYTKLLQLIAVSDEGINSYSIDKMLIEIMSSDTN